MPLKLGTAVGSACEQANVCLGQKADLALGANEVGSYANNGRDTAVIRSSDFMEFLDGYRTESRTRFDISEVNCLTWDRSVAANIKHTLHC